MNEPVPMAEVWRGDILESVHLGHAVVCDASGDIVGAWGNPDAVILPRSSCKMIQALPLLESGAADAYGLTPEHLALACASHQGSPIHTEKVQQWLSGLGLGDNDLLCGPQAPRVTAVKHAMIRSGENLCRYHNNCSGKHTGFLTFGKHTGAGPEYVDLDHPLQLAIQEAFEDVTDQASPGHGIDGCSAPNYATTVVGLAKSMAFFATAKDTGPVRHRSAARLVQAMIAFPELVSGAGRASTELMRAMKGITVVKDGAEGTFIAIAPESGLGMAVKIADGAERASECAITALLVKFGLLDENHPQAVRQMNAVQHNYAGLETGFVRTATNFPH